jgi:hypothetical protein
MLVERWQTSPESTEFLYTPTIQSFRPFLNRITCSAVGNNDGQRLQKRTPFLSASFRPANVKRLAYKAETRSAKDAIIDEKLKSEYGSSTSRDDGRDDGRTIERGSNPLLRA